MCFEFDQHVVSAPDSSADRPAESPAKALLIEHLHYLTAVLPRLIHRRYYWLRPEDIEDVVQDTACRVLAASPPRLAGIDSVLGFLYSEAVGRVGSLLRKHRRAMESLDAPRGGADAVLGDDLQDEGTIAPLAELERREAVEALRLHVLKLRAKEREVLLGVLAGHSPAEQSLRLGQSGATTPKPNTLAATGCRARKRLRGLLARVCA